MREPLPERILAWYGDDFTGSTDVLEAVASRGFEAVLFLEQPDEAFFARFAGYRAFGLAGSSRSESPEWMDAHLPPAFTWLRSTGAALCHYKVCSTFDSSPRVGSIGRALEIGRRVFAAPWVPVIVGAPSLKRYVVFGNLFAAVDGRTYRIDRHPTMSRHPVTPMHEADLRLHLGAQMNGRIELMDVLDPDAALAAKSGAGAVVFDTCDEPTLARAGRLVWESKTPFVVGSSGVEYSLMAHWGRPAVPSPAPAKVDQLVVLSGSCSPVTAQQIEHAGKNGFARIKLDAAGLARGEGVERAIGEAREALGRGASVVLYSAAGPEDRVALEGARNALAHESGRVLTAVLDSVPVRRAIVAGGDTSSHAGRQLGIQALTYICPLAPGAPLCRAWSNQPARDGIEIVFKGGQCGGPAFFSEVSGS